VTEATRKIARDYGGAVFVAVAIALFLRFLVIEAYRIPTSSMRPTLEAGDTIFVAKWPLGFDRKPERGDVIVYAAPSDPERDYIKRVVAVAGDTIGMRKGRLVLNDKELASAGSPSPPTGAATGAKDCGSETLPAENGSRSYGICWEPPIAEDFGPEKVPDGSVFVLGDLRGQGSADAKKRKTWGTVPLNAIRGKALWVWLSTEPDSAGMSPAWFPNFRFERMFRRIE
jgi:signal peptidase I